jgi:hypothetical protein
MKATIVECRRLTNFEKVLSPTNEYLTVWQLENGKKYKKKTLLPGGYWTYLYLEDKLCPTSKVDKHAQENLELAKEVGYSKVICTGKEMKK